MNKLPLKKSRSKRKIKKRKKKKSRSNDHLHFLNLDAETTTILKTILGRGTATGVMNAETNCYKQTTKCGDDADNVTTTSVLTASGPETKHSTPKVLLKPNKLKMNKHLRKMMSTHTETRKPRS